MIQNEVGVDFQRTSKNANFVIRLYFSEKLKKVRPEQKLAVGGVDSLVVDKGLVKVQKESVFELGLEMDVGRGAGFQKLNVPAGPISTR